MWKTSHHICPRWMFRGVKLSVGFPLFLNVCIIHDRQCMPIILWWLRAVKVGCAIFHVFGLIFNITFLVIYVAFLPCCNFVQGHSWHMSERIMEVSRLSPIWNDPMNISRFGWITLIVASLKYEVFPRGFKGTLTNVEETDGDHLYVIACCKPRN